MAECVVCYWNGEGVDYGYLDPQFIVEKFKVCKKHEEEQMDLKFGKFKGQTIEAVSKTEEGVGYLQWLKKNTDPNDAKYGKSNKATLAEINRCLALVPKKDEYVKDNSQLPKSAGGTSLEKKLDLIIALIKKAYPDVYAEYKLEEAQVETDQAPF